MTAILGLVPFPRKSRKACRYLSQSYTGGVGRDGVQESNLELCRWRPQWVAADTCTCLASANLQVVAMAPK